VVVAEGIGVIGGFIFFIPVLFIDGFLSAGRYNKKLIEKVLAKEDAKEAKA